MIKYRVVIKDPMDNTIRIDTGEVSDKANFLYDFRIKGYPSMIGGLIIGTISIEWDSTDGDR